MPVLIAGHRRQKQSCRRRQRRNLLILLPLRATARPRRVDESPSGSRPARL